MEPLVKYTCPKCEAVHGYYPYRGKCCRCGEKIEREDWIIKKYGTHKEVKPVPGEKQIVALTALVTTLQGTPGSKLKKRVLYESLKAQPFLEKFIRITYDPNIDLGIDSYDVQSASVEAGCNIRDVIRDRLKRKHGKMLDAARLKGICHRMGEPFSTVLMGVLDKNLKIGLKTSGINKVLKRLGRPLIKED